MSTPKLIPLILIADGNTNDLLAVTHALGNEEYSFSTVNNGAELKNVIAQLRPQVVVFSYENLGEITGQEILIQCADKYPETKFIVTSESDNSEQIVNCIKLGATDYLIKPLQQDKLISSVSSAVKLQNLETLQREMNGAPSSRLDLPREFDAYIGDSLLSLAFLKKASIFAKRSFPVLLIGENGIGKHLLSRLIHKASGRTGDYVSVSPQGLPDEEFYKEYYNAIRRCNNGTLYMEDVSRLPIHQQQLLIKWFQDQRIRFPYTMNLPDMPVADIRLIFGTTQPLEQLLQEKKFDEKLYYRLTTNSVSMVPLRENRNDIPVLLDYFLGVFSRKLGKPIPTYPKELVSLLKSYHFPGNVAELSAMVENALAFHDKRMLSTSSFSHVIETRRTKSQLSPNNSVTFRECLQLLEPFISMKEAKQLYVEEAMRRSDGNQSAAGKLLGVTRQAVNNYLTGRAKVEPAADDEEEA